MRDSLNKILLIILFILIVKESFSQNPDSIIYIIDKWGLTTITTPSAESEKMNPFAPPTALPVNVSKMCHYLYDYF